MSPALVGAAIVQTVVYLLFIRAVDLYEREALRYVIPVFVWGFTVAAAVSLVFNTLFAVAISATLGGQVAQVATSVFVAPVVEESAKGLALLVAFFVSLAFARARRVPIEFSGVMDGIVYGSAVGFGFAIAEDLLYYAQAGPEVFLVRRIFGGFAHAAFASLTGIGIGLIPWVRYRSLRPVPPIVGLAAAMFLHACFNFTATFFGALVYVALFFVLLIYAAIIVAWLAVERRAIREELRDEVTAGTITPEEYELLPSYFRRTGHYLKLILSGRIGDWLRDRKVHATAVDLALSKRLLRRATSVSREDRVRALRRRLLKLRGAPAPRAASV